jgi:ATP-dependent Clp protease ATP-binding subunit ClpX
MDIVGEENKSSLVKSRDGIPASKEICKVLDAVWSKKLNGMS